jgi:GAF domain-containing protein
MRKTGQRPRSIAQQFTRSYLLVSVLPLFLALLLTLGGFIILARRSADLIQGSTRDLNAQAEEHLRHLGEQYIQTVARDVARQVAIYLAAHPDATMQELQADDEFAGIAMQLVGETGYTCLYEAGTGIMRIHPNPNLIDREMSFLRDQIPTWWAIFEPSLTGTEVSGYYDWLEPDGSIRQKYMTMTPVEVPFHGTTLMIAATTYIDEFSRPVVSMQEQAQEIETRYRGLTIQQGTAVASAGAALLLITIGVVYALGRRAAMQYIRPIQTLSEMSGEIGKGRGIREEQVRLLRRQDEIGTLMQAFIQASTQIEDLVNTLERRVAERTASLERRSAQMEAAAQVARGAAAIRDVRGLLDETVRLISERFGFYHAGLFLLDEDREYAVLQAASSEGGQRMLARGHKLAVGRVGIVGYVAATGEPRIALDVGEDAVFFDNPDLPETRSEMALPLKARDRVIGVLDVQSVEPSAFTTEDVAVLQTMADQLALAIENAHLIEEAESRLREVSVLLARSSQEGWSRLVASRPEWRYVYDRVDVRPAPVPDDSQITIPLRVREGTIGRLSLRLGDRQPDAEEIALVQTIADQASQALESARLFQETQRALGEMEGLYRAIQAVSTVFDLEALTDKLVEEACRLLSADYGVLVTLDPATGAMRHFKTAGIAPGECTLPEFPQGRGILKALLEGQTVRVDRLDDHPSYSGSLPPNHLPISSFLGVPLIYQNQVRGLLGVSNRATNPTFDEASERLLGTFAAQATVSIENARLFDEARRRAERERLVADISAQVRSSVEVETILRTSIRELGRALRASDGLIRLGSADGDGSSHPTPED